jgi:ABC-type lipoprotein release transport system permease subunit
MGAQLIGVDPASETAMTHLADKIIDGRYLSDGAAGEIIVGDGLASKLRLAIGDELVAVTQAADGSTGNDLYTVVGLFHTGSLALDRGGAYLHADDLRELLVLPGQSHEITVLAPNREAIDGMVAAAAPVVEAGGSMIRPWTEINPQFAQMMEMADVSGIIMMFFIFGVAALGILNTMLMSVFERTKELGVIRALGLRPSRMFALVMLETFALTAVACLVGLPLGLAGDIWLITSGLDLSGVMDSTSVMGIDYDPIYMGAWDTGHFLQVVIGLFVISSVAAVWPAFRVARLQPVEAMRQE